jgi:hypothetical protein
VNSTEKFLKRKDLSDVAAILAKLPFFCPAAKCYYSYSLFKLKAYCQP